MKYVKKELPMKNINRKTRELEEELTIYAKPK